MRGILFVCGDDNCIRHELSTYNITKNIIILITVILNQYYQYRHIIRLNV